MSQLDLSESVVFELISQKHRRYVIDVLASQESPLTLSELVDAVAAKKQEEPVDTADNSALSVRLYHVDLPKLHEYGIIEPCENDEDVCITPDFRSSWYDWMASLRENDTQTVLATHLDAAPSDIVIERSDELISVRYNDQHLGSWRSKPLLIADVATELELQERYPEWSHLLIQERGQVIGGLRVFLNQCPDCLEPVTEQETKTETCCSFRTEIAGECVDCGTQLYSLTQPATA